MSFPVGRRASWHRGRPSRAAHGSVTSTPHLSGTVEAVRARAPTYRGSSPLAPPVVVPKVIANRTWKVTGLARSLSSEVTSASLNRRTAAAPWHGTETLHVGTASAGPHVSHVVVGLSAACRSPITREGNRTVDTLARCQDADRHRLHLALRHRGHGRRLAVSYLRPAHEVGHPVWRRRVHCLPSAVPQGVVVPRSALKCGSPGERLFGTPARSISNREASSAAQRGYHTSDPLHLRLDPRSLARGRQWRSWQILRSPLPPLQCPERTKRCGHLILCDLRHSLSDPPQRLTHARTPRFNWSERSS